MFEARGARTKKLFINLIAQLGREAKEDGFILRIDLAIGEENSSFCCRHLVVLWMRFGRRHWEVC